MQEELFVALYVTKNKNIKLKHNTSPYMVHIILINIFKKK